MAAAVTVIHPARDSEVFNNIGRCVGMCEKGNQNHKAGDASAQEKAVHNLLLFQLIICQGSKTDRHNRQVSHASNRFQICGKVDIADSETIENMEAEDECNER